MAACSARRADRPLRVPCAPMSELERFPEEPYPRRGPGCDRVLIDRAQRVMITGDGALHQVRDLGTGRVLRELEIPKRTSSALSADGRRLISGDKQNRVRLFDVETGACLGENGDFEDWLEEVVWLPDDRHFAAVSRVGGLVVGDGQTMQTVFRHQVLEKERFADGLVALPSGGHAILSSGRTLRCIDLRDGQTWWERSFGWASVGQVSIDPTGSFGVALVELKEAVTLQFFDTRTGAQGPVYTFRSPGGITWPDFDPMFTRWFPVPRISPDGSVVAANTPVGNLVIVDARTGSALWEAPRMPGMAWISDLAWLADSNHLVLGCADNTIAIWRLRPPQCVSRMPVK